MNEMQLQRLFGKVCCQIGIFFLLCWPLISISAFNSSAEENEPSSVQSKNLSILLRFTNKTKSPASQALHKTVKKSNSVSVHILQSSSRLDASEISAQAEDSVPDTDLNSTALLNSTLEEEDSFFSEINSTDLLLSVSPTSSVEGDDPGSPNSHPRVSQSLIPDIQSVTIIPNLRAPLMSLLVAPTDYSKTAPMASTTVQHAAQPLTTASDNEISFSSHIPVPTQPYNKLLLMLVLRADDCARFSKSEFQKTLTKVMTKLGLVDIIPELSTARCYSNLNINLTMGGPNPILRFLPSVDGKNNFTVDVLNKSFRVIKFEKVDLKLERNKSFSEILSDILAFRAIQDRISLGIGAALAFVFIVAAIKFSLWWDDRRYRKKNGIPKNLHARLRPQDYTLTPFPRPNSQSTEYYKKPCTAQIFSTSLAGSIAVGAPTGAVSVVQPFDTSIVPLKDSSAFPTPRDLSLDSVPAQADPKTFNIQGLPSKVLRSVTVDFKEKQLLSKVHAKEGEAKPNGVTNPTFQRF